MGDRFEAVTLEAGSLSGALQSVEDFATDRLCL